MPTPERQVTPTLSVAQALEAAYGHHSQGNLTEAERLYEAILSVDADEVDALHFLGVIRKQQGRADEAVRLIGAALRLDPDYVEAHVNLGATLNDLGRHEEALASYRRALAVDPALAGVNLNVGLVLGALGRHEEAAASYRRALAIEPDFAAAHGNLGTALKALGLFAEAEASYRRALAVEPGYAALHNNLGNALKEQARFAEAEASYCRALEINADFAEAHSNLGNARQEQGWYAEAEAAYRRALAIRPDFAEAHNNLSASLKEQGRLAEAEASCRRALELRPGYAEAHRNLGVALEAQGRLAEAETSYRRALELKPEYAEAHSSLLFGLNYAAAHSPSFLLEEAREYGRRLERRVAGPFASWHCALRPERLRVGLVAGELRNHPVGYFAESLIACIEPSRVELIAYPTRHEADELTARVRQRLAAWKPLVGSSDEAAARLIHADGVHVLLDLSGHTPRNRLGVFGWRPAPVQASWLGYFATTGVAAMDYLLADETGVPAAARDQFSETIWYLEGTRLCFSAPQADVPVAPLPALAGGCLTFGCFQHSSKVGDEVLAAWARIFAALPTAQLRLQSKQLRDPALRQWFSQRLERHGIAPARVAMHGFVPREAYLAAHGEVDVILDTFPYTGGTTTCEALWMGVPTLTLAGDTLLARQGASLLAAAGLPDWVAATPAEYVDKAVALAGDLPRLAALRAQLRGRVLASPLFDAPRFARNFEAALWAMWRRRAGQGLG